ncbi:hypothetical protein SAMN05216371_4670 [Streptomyces sp. TLI_053]|uniref:hypothetical protein n=1 Tax=Streptomyces sp. TLI_053 TaxID=1855352 RepID=UPI00087ADDEE|nr:hypothetical protein [Streptomyces sp. TLI_053]SDT74218.1 hypothetical protein SAMN05216371_4670 [Streptomyces sp. TLI_053]
MSSFRCPQCGEVDQVRSVPAVREAHISTFAGTSTGHTYDHTVTTHTVGTSSSLLADRLAPPAAPRMADPGYGCGIVAALLLTFGAGLFAVMVLVTGGSDDQDGRRAALIVYSGLAAVFLIVTVGLVKARRQRLGQVRQEFEAYAAVYPSLVTAWRSSYLCGRCHLTFLPNGVIDLGLGRTAMAPVERFPDLVAFVAARLRGA